MNKPKHFLVFKILAGVFACGAIAGIALIVSGFGNFETDNFMIGGMLFPFCLMGTIACAIIGFRPEMAKLSARSRKYVQSQVKDDLQEISTTQAEITAPAVTATARAVKEGLTDEENVMYCTQCGAQIARDSKFCKECGAQQ